MDKEDIKCIKEIVRREETYHCLYCGSKTVKGYGKVRKCTSCNIYQSLDTFYEAIKDIIKKMD